MGSRQLAVAFVLGAVSTGVPLHSNEATMLSEGLGLTETQLSATLDLLTNIKAVVTDDTKPEAKVLRLAHNIELDYDTLPGRIGDELALLDLQRAENEIEAEFAARNIREDFGSEFTVDGSGASGGSGLL